MVKNSPDEVTRGKLLSASASSTLGTLRAEVQSTVMLKIGWMLWCLPSFCGVSCCRLSLSPAEHHQTTAHAQAWSM